MQEKMSEKKSRATRQQDAQPQSVSTRVCLCFRFDPGLLQLVTRRTLRTATAVSKAAAPEQLSASWQEDQEALEDLREVGRGMVALLAASVNSPR